MTRYYFLKEPLLLYPASQLDQEKRFLYNIILTAEKEEHSNNSSLFQKSPLCLALLFNQFNNELLTLRMILKN